MPNWLHDVFGRTQRVGDLILIAVVGLSFPVCLFVLYPEAFATAQAWRSALAFILILDIAAGCIANLTTGTNDYYASRPPNRWAFIALHVHLPLVAILLDLDLRASIMVWAFTIVGTTLVNLLRPGSSQRTTAGALFCVGACGIVIGLGSTPLLACVSLLFMLKVLVHFAVDHRADGR